MPKDLKEVKPETVVELLPKARIARVRAALELIAEGADRIVDAGNEPMPGFVAYGFAEAMRWAAQQLGEIEKSLPEKEGGR